MKVAVIGDLHAGGKDGNIVLMEQQLDYLVDVFIPYLQSNNIKTIYQVGDIFDVRKGTNTHVLHQWKLRFFKLLSDLNIKMETLVGNHDMYFRNTIHPNTLSEHLDQYDNITINDEVAEYSGLTSSEIWCPWICKENHEDIFKMIEKSKANICFGHFEIKGARMESSVCTDGLPVSMFKKFDLVLSGHFHSKGRYDNVQYVGTPYQMCWGDYGHDKGFYILDTKSLDLEFIQNTNDLFIKITYDEDKSMDMYLDEDLKNKYIKVVVENRDNFPKYEKWFSRLETKGMTELKVIEPLMDRSGDNTDVEVNEELSTQSTEDLIVEYVEDLYPERKEKLSRMMLSLHAECR